MLIPLGILAASGAGAVAEPAYELISTTILSSASPSVVFSNLSQYASTYKHLQLRTSARSNFTGGGITGGGVRFNGDSAANYSSHSLFTNGGGTPGSTGYANTTEMGMIGVPNDGSGNPGVFGSAVVTMLDVFSSTRFKTIRGISAMTGSQPDYLSLDSGAWRSTAVVDSLTVFCFGASFRAGSRISLYGIRG